MFRHEVIHASERQRGPHGPRFARWDTCQFWPDFSPTTGRP